ncbi:MAG: type II toxin-antitoxin system RelE/ParE family toxin [bacterium]|nr:type II toxin-antitoxin system RelE/ParE family toxin [bacterium]
MKYKPELTPDAEIDVSEAFEWYESRRKGLGHDFLLQVDAGLQSIGRNPYLAVERYQGVRRYIIKRFPHKILYCVEGRNVIVLAVIYSGRDPEWIRKRIAHA